jgi:hypothetical protein
MALKSKRVLICGFAVLVVALFFATVILGASGVDVGGTLYDVEFRDRTCFAFFDRCDSVADFTFQTPSTANAASQAPLDQVFSNWRLGSFNTPPELTSSSATPDTVAFATSLGISDDITMLVSNTYALLTPVPEPSTGVLMAAGLALLSARRRNRAAL